MGRERNNKKIWLVVLLGVTGLVLLTVLAINPLLKKLLVTRVENKLVGNFHYNYDHLTVDLLTRSVTFENVTWRFPKDTTIFNHKGGIGLFRIGGISLLSLIRGNDFQIQEIRFENLNLVTRIEKQLNEDSIPKINTEGDSFNFYDLIKGQMKSLDVEEIVIVDGTAVWLNPETEIVWRKIESIQFNIEHIELDSINAVNNNGWFTLRNASLEGKNVELFFADSLHKIHLKEFRIDYKKQTISVDSLVLSPLVTKSEMSHVKRYETNRMEISIPKLRLTGMDIGALMIHNQLRIEHILIDQLNLHIFRDKNPPIPSDLHIDLPQLALKKAVQNIKIDTVVVANGYLQYEELREITHKSGVVFFSKMNMELFNITNDSSSYQWNSQSKMRVSALLMGKGRLDVKVTFNLLSEKGNHSLKGSLGHFGLAQLNPIFVPLKAFSIRSGHVDKLTFDIMLNDDVSTGKINFLYTKLKIDKLNKGNLNHQEFDDFLLSALVNTFLVYSSNPKGTKDPRIGLVYYQREKDKSIYHFWLNSVLEGMKSTASRSKAK